MNTFLSNIGLFSIYTLIFYAVKKLYTYLYYTNGETGSNKIDMDDDDDF